MLSFLCENNEKAGFMRVKPGLSSALTEPTLLEDSFCWVLRFSFSFIFFLLFLPVQKF